MRKPLMGIALIAASLYHIPLFAQDDPDLTVGPISGYSVVSPDGQSMAFVSNASGMDTIWVAKSDGTHSQAFITWPSSVQKDPDWSPDGTMIVFSSDQGGHGFNIWVTSVVPGTPPQAGSPIQLTNNSQRNEKPRFSPDGTQIVFLSNRTGKRELWMMAANGGSQREVSPQSLHVNDPSWSPDGTQIAFSGCSDVSCNLFAIPVSGGQARQITMGNYQDWSPDWSANGILFASNRAGVQGLWLVQPDGTNLSVMTNPGGTGDVNPRWNRHMGTSFVFTRASVIPGFAGANIWSGTMSGGTQQVTAIYRALNYAVYATSLEHAAPSRFPEVCLRIASIPGEEPIR